MYLHDSNDANCNSHIQTIAATKDQLIRRQWQFLHLDHQPILPLQYNITNIHQVNCHITSFNGRGIDKQSTGFELSIGQSKCTDSDWGKCAQIYHTIPIQTCGQVALTKTYGWNLWDALIETLTGGWFCTQQETKSSSMCIPAKNETTGTIDAQVCQ